VPEVDVRDQEKLLNQLDQYEHNVLQPENTFAEQFCCFDHSTLAEHKRQQQNTQIVDGWCMNQKLAVPPLVLHGDEIALDKHVFVRFVRKISLFEHFFVDSSKDRNQVI